MVPAPHIVQEEERVKTAASRRRVSQSKADADPAQVVEDLLSDLESSPSLRDPPARHVRPAASGLLKGLMDDFTGADAPPKYDTPADIAKRESAARLAREEERGVFNKDGASVQLMYRDFTNHCLFLFPLACFCVFACCWVPAQLHLSTDTPHTIGTARSVRQRASPRAIGAGEWIMCD
jgi:hypothetical protein